jgi:general secretion pathway protein D
MAQSSCSVGLIGDNYSGGTSKVPLLGDIPWLGQFFRSENKARTKDNLMVFLRPVIVHDELDSAAISQNRYQYMRSQQLGYQTDNRVIKDADVPVMPPAVPTGPDIDPAQNLFDLRDMTRQQSAAPSASASGAPRGDQ